MYRSSGGGVGGVKRTDHDVKLLGPMRDESYGIWPFFSSQRRAFKETVHLFSCLLFSSLLYTLFLFFSACVCSRVDKKKEEDSDLFCFRNREDRKLNFKYLRRLGEGRGVNTEL